MNKPAEGKDEPKDLEPAPQTHIDDVRQQELLPADLLQRVLEIERQPN